MNRFRTTLCLLATAVLTYASAPAPAIAGTPPAVTGLWVHRGPYWGDTLVTVRGRNFSQVTHVLFGSSKGHHVRVLDSTTLTVRTPTHGYGSVNLRVVTAAGISAKSAADRFTFLRPTMDTPIQGGLTARQEQRISAQVRAAHRNPPAAARSGHWTAAMGTTAVRRAASWIGVPYSWAGGDARGPTAGVCAHNGGDMDCHIVGFDCSGLALYSWGPYRALAHYAQTQYSRAGRFHPAVGELMPGDLVFFSAYLPHGIGHVAVYEGSGIVIEAAQSGTRVKRSRLVELITDDGAYRGATRPLSTGRQGAVPYVSQVTPTVSSNGGALTITGSHLGAATSVTFGGTVLYSLHRSENRLVVQVPAHAAGRTPVVVSNLWGGVTKAVTVLAPPRITAPAPARGPVTGGTTVTVAGSGLAAVTRVTVGTVSVPFHVVAATRITLTMPAHAPGRVLVTAFSPYGASAPVGYTYAGVPLPTPSPPPGTAEPSPTGAPGVGTAVPSATNAPAAAGTG